jgi:EF-P beta-lysylation protein EpmB
LDTPDWQRELATAFTSSRQLLEHLGLSDHPIAAQGDDAPDFPVRVPAYFAGLMRHGDPHDPLLLQVLARRIEHVDSVGFGDDPVGDRASVAGAGLLQKYHGRALLIASPACAVHCRYCFRRHFPYGDTGARGDWSAVIEQLRSLAVDELILSGGDPLTLSDRRLGDLLSRLDEVPSLRRVRVHTRLPVVLPKRLTDGLLQAFRRLHLPCAWVLHINHHREIAPALREATAALRDTGATLLNQAVLLKSVNDDADTLEILSSELFASGVLPYYLHLLDPVAGAAHFDVAPARAQSLHRELRRRLPGYLVPQLVREIPGADSKVALADGRAQP